MRIGVAGAGVGGLAAAALLTDAGHEVTVFDQFAAPKPIGSGLVIQPVGQDVLASLGVLDAAVARGQALVRMLGVEVTSGRKALDVWYDRRSDPVHFGLAIHRSGLFDVLLEAVKHRAIRLEASKRVVGATNGALTFKDGTTSDAFDLIVDALGAGSPLSPLKARALPFGAIWGTVDWPDNTDLRQDYLNQRYRHADHMIGVMACGTVSGETGRKATLFWSLPEDGYDTWRDAGIAAWRSDALPLWPELAPFINQITDPDQMTMARYSHGTLRWPISDRVVHIGDAAHRASPQLGQGANMALLDAAALTKALSGHHLDDALRSYAINRRYHVGLYQLMSAAFTPMYQSRSRVLPFLRDRVLYPISQIPPGPSVLTHIVRGTMLPTGVR